MPNEESQVLGIEEQGMSPVMSGQEGEISAESPAMGAPEKPKDKPKDKEAEQELIKRMMFSPSSSSADNTLELDSTTDVDEKEKKANEDLIKILDKGDKKTSEKYRKELLDKALKDPTSVEIETERGWMTVRDAIEQGVDMATGKFTNEPMPPRTNWDDEISKLSPNDQEAIRKLTGKGVGKAPGRPVEGLIGEEEPMGPQAIGENVGPEGNVTPSDAGLTEQGNPLLPGINTEEGPSIPLG